MKRNFILFGLFALLFSTVSSIFCWNFTMKNELPNDIDVLMYERTGTKLMPLSGELRCRKHDNPKVVELGGNGSDTVQTTCCIVKVEIEIYKHKKIAGVTSPTTKKTIWEKKGKGRVRSKCSGTLVIKKVGDAIIGMWE